MLALIFSSKATRIEDFSMSAAVKLGRLVNHLVLSHKNVLGPFTSSI